MTEREVGYRYRPKFDQRLLREAERELRKLAAKAGKLGRVRLKDRGFVDFARRLDDAQRLEVVAGVIEDDAARPHTGGAATIGDVAEYQFSGTATIPPRRPEVRGPVADKILEYGAKAITSGTDPRVALERVAAGLAGAMKKKIREGLPPPLVSRVGTPLVDTGQLWGAIRGKVRPA